MKKVFEDHVINTASSEVLAELEKYNLSGSYQFFSAYNAIRYMCLTDPENDLGIYDKTIAGLQCIGVTNPEEIVDYWINLIE